MTTSGASSPVFTTLPAWTSRLPVRPSIGARIVVYASWSFAASTMASFAFTAARALSMVASAARAAASAFSMAARSARTVASSVEKFVRTWSYCSRAISPRSISVR